MLFSGLLPGNIRLSGWLESPTPKSGGSKDVHQDTYLLELTRYIHLNPLRVGIVKDLGALDTYYCAFWQSGNWV